MSAIKYDMRMGTQEPIAVIGTGCRFPGDSTSPSKLWELIKHPRDIAKEITQDRLYFHPDNKHHGTSNIRHSYFLEDNFKLFDAKFFGVKPAEALAMDPQQRLLLETVYESLEAAGIPIHHLKGSHTGVYVGNMGGDYSELLGQDLDSFPMYFAPGTARSVLSNRISYFFDWHGPSVTVDTACSSSLVAVHQAVQSLRLGETNVAVACGTNLLLSPSQYIAESKLKMLGPGGRSRMWDESADGYARGEGFASVVLKTLSAALRDGDDIECLIRETGVNQDGRTKGITMPSPLAQAELIRNTYKRAGLDLSRPGDRPQYFEAHGTGTPAGDPVEAEAISTAFFGSKSGFRRSEGAQKLYVGSIKTVIGHTEGTAGLAALLKASLAMQARRIPPNLHFHRLNPAIEPFYADLEVPTVLKEWPQPEPGQPLRASVNSFGFGGANAHCILESYDPLIPTSAPGPSTACAPVFAPFTMSANSESSLARLMQRYKSYLDLNPSTNLRNLAFTLNSHRSTLDKRVAISAVDIDGLKQRLSSLSKQEKPSDGVLMRSSDSRPRILGIFTGQGAQWPRMGADIVESSAPARAILEELQQSLDRLPEKDRPAWSLLEELLAEPDKSRVHQARISQPLCAAVQMMLVRLLRAAGVSFDMVVGHSSGEFAAAYTAGYLSAEDAIRAAYYRGLHTHLASGPGGEEGGMMAVGTSFEDAQQLCELEVFTGRLCVGASNSRSIVTLSGDLDALDEAKEIMDAEGKFTRMLKVDKAYHSHHMLPCVDPYIQSLRDCGVQAQTPRGPSCPWISSVHVKDMSTVAEDEARVQDRYWSSNMAKPVMFSQALWCALSGEQRFDHVVEVGPHPALIGPASQTIQEVFGEKLPYSGCLNRGKNSIQAFSDGLGAIWSSLGPSAVDFAGYEAFVSGGAEQRLLKGLPSYTWDHDRGYYLQSRTTRALLGENTPTNELLGTRLTANTASQIQWRNSLNSAELPWLLQHHAQGQTVFPGMGYVSTVLEAVSQVFVNDPIQMVELRDLVIGHALVIEENVGVETVFSLTGIRRVGNKDKTTAITAHWSFVSHQGTESTDLIENASGGLHIKLGEAAEDTLAGKLVPDNQLKDLDEERFYSALETIGYGYSGPFKALSNLRRRMCAATGLVTIPHQTPLFDRLVAHPAALDATVQSILAAYCFPGDTRLEGIYLPTGIDCIRFNFAHCVEQLIPGAQLPFWASVPLTDDSQDVGGDVDVYSQCGRFTLIQLQGLHTKPLYPPSAATDLHLFSETVWKPLLPKGANLELHGEERLGEAAMFDAMERVAYFYMRTVAAEFALGEKRAGLAQHHLRFLAYADHTRARVVAGTLPHIGRGWEQDTRDGILKLIAAFPDSIDLQLMHAVGENLPGVFRGEINALEPMVKNNMLNRFYVDAIGMSRYTQDLARMVAHLTHRYPHMRILEVGAGTGGATKVILERLSSAFASYTYTDISSGFFGEAREVFRAHEAKMVFKTLDIEKDPAGQGYEPHSFDVVVANLVVHATRSLPDTMTQLRRLVRPGGYLLLLEITDNDPLRFGFIFGGLPGWWLGGDSGDMSNGGDDRVFSPCVPVEKWDAVMRGAGFSGVDVVTPHHAFGPLSVILSQAVDDRVGFLRQPLSSSSSTLPLDFGLLTIVGGASALTGELQRLLSPRYKHVSVILSMEEVAIHGLPIMGTVLSLVELQSPVLQDITHQRLEGLKQVFQQSSGVYWVTCGASGNNPYASMVMGVGRTIVLEMKHIRLGFLDFTLAEDAVAHRLAEKLLQFEASEVWDQQARQGEQPQDRQHQEVEALPGLTWYQEPELRFEGGEFKIPRIQLSRDRNARYNSRRRAVTEEVDPCVSPVTLKPLVEGGLALVRQTCGPVCAETRTDTVRVIVSYSMLRSIRLTSSDYLFLVLGTDDATGKPLFALADSQTSLVEVDRSWTIPCPTTPAQGKHALVLMYKQIMAQTAVEGLKPSSTLVVLDADPSMAAALSRRSAESGITLTLLNTREGETKTPGAINIHPLESLRSLRQALPHKVSRFIDLSSGSSADSGDSNTAVLVAKCFATSCQREGLASLTDVAAHVTAATFVGLEHAVAGVLRASWAHARSDEGVFSPSRVASVTAIDVVQEGQSVPDGTCLVEWTSASKVSARVQPADSLVTFKHDRTYWLVGLTGGLALSLCRWMVDRGARYVVMTSRNPKVDPGWLRSVEALGATVRIMVNDVTKRDAVLSAFNTITATMPAIAGVAQGAMVLDDTTFADTTLETVETILGPKVQGSIHLDAIFHSAPLDWFVFLSSVVCTSGNPGQSIYAGANMFMNALAAQRRRRGVPASSVEIGAIVGNGSVTSKLSFERQKYLFSVGNTWMSEQDFLTMFAEAVLASPADSSQSVTAITGLRLHYSDEKPDITWFSNPMFQHLVLETGKGASAGVNTSKHGEPVRAQLQGAKGSEEVYIILRDAFLAKVQSSLQTEGGTDVLGVALEALGMDSLVAVDLRSWFLKELSVDVPVLKILNAGTAGALLEFVQETVIRSFEPGGDHYSDTKSELDQVQTSAHQQSQTSPPIELPAAEDRPEIATDTGTGTSSSAAPSNEADSGSSDLDATSETSVSASAEDLRPILQRVVPISFAQSRFWFLKSYVEDPLAFNVTSLMRIRGPLRAGDFSKAMGKVCQHHEALRTSFSVVDNVPVQRVWNLPAFRLEVRSITDEREVKEAYEMIRNNLYDLEAGRTMRIQLLSKSSTEHFLVLGYHHINMDGISFEILFRDLERAYKGESLNTSVNQYPDFSLQEAKEYSSGQWKGELDYWREQYRTLPEPLPLLPLSKKISRPTHITYKTHTVQRRMTADQSSAVKETCRRFQASPFHFHLAVFKAVLARYSSTEELCIGIADANRKEASVMEAMGLYLNLLPLRVTAPATQRFGEALEEMRLKSQEAFAHSKVPIDVLLNELGVPRSSSHAPLFQSFLNYRRGVAEVRPFCGCEGFGELIGGGQMGYDISVDIVENPGGDSLIFMAVQEDLYDAADAGMLLDNYFSLVDAFSKNAAAQLGSPAMHDATAVEEALRLGCGPVLDLLWPETLVHRIEDMGLEHPTRVALKDGQGITLSYAEMALRVDAIASRLLEADLGGDGSVVGVMQASTLDFVCSILAVWKMGYIYVALDPRLSTTDRLAAVVSECQPACILLDASTSGVFGQLKSTALPIDLSTSYLPSGCLDIPNKAIAAAPAAVLYTSGSTGKPKGVCLSHASLRVNIELATHQFGFAEGSDVMLQQAAFSFDMSLSQMLLALANGGTLVVAPGYLRGDAVGLTQLIAAEGVTFTQATPTEYMSWLLTGAEQLEGSAWRVAACGGETMTGSVLRRFRSIGKTDLRLFNGYGPSEITFTCHTSEVPYPFQEPVPLLQTWPNYSVYIVDKDIRPQPIGVSGEICIGGGGVGLGYFRDEARTSQAFVHDSHASAEFAARGWKTVHRTGDCGRLTADGGLVLEGRIVGDTQIKLRGIRMDLRDIEAAIVQAGDGRVRDAAASVRQDDELAPQYLVAHVVMASGSSPEGEEDVTSYLVQLLARLPLAQHMRPSVLVPTTKLPVNSSHKLDRMAVQTMPVTTSRQGHSGAGQTAALTPLQAEIRGLWEQVIPGHVGSNYTIGLDTDFFHVGGTSLLLVNLQRLLKDKFGEPPALAKMFESSTLAGMVGLLSSTPDTPGKGTPSSPSVIDWEHETAIPVSPPTLLPSPSTSTRPSSPAQIVVLTGATGFLGQHLVRVLLQQPSITRIHCVATRPRDGSHKQQQLPAILTSDPRIVIHRGDLGADGDLLGLSAEDAAAVFGEADVIIHNGADVSFLKSYTTLRRTNVASARALAALAASARGPPAAVPIHLVSSASVAQLSGLGSFGEVSAAGFPPASSAPSDGYTAAKWAAERVLERAAAAWGVPVTVHRPSSIVGEGAGELDLMQNLFRLVEEMQAVPASGAWKGNFDFVSVENVAADIVAAAVEGEKKQGEELGQQGPVSATVRYRYEAGEIVYPLAVMEELRAEAGDGAKLPIRTMPLAEWVEEAQALGLNSMLAEYLLLADRNGSPLAFPRLVKTSFEGIGT